jgi:hypothetical protein
MGATGPSYIVPTCPSRQSPTKTKTKKASSFGEIAPVGEAPPAPTGVGVIEVRVRDLDRLFNTIDPSPFRDRDLDRDADEYIVSNARELPSKVPLALVVYLEQPVDPHDDSRVLGDAIRLHFARRVQTKRWALRQLLRRGRISLVIGLLFLTASIAGGDFVLRSMGERPLAIVLRESMLIGGWVAMWRPMEIFLHDWWPLRDERRILDRLSKMDVRVLQNEGHGTTGEGSGHAGAGRYA